MKKLIIFLLFFVSFFGAIGQSVIQRTPGTNTVNDPRQMHTLNLFIPRYFDTTAANASIGIDSCGAVIFTYTGNLVWARGCSPKRWTIIGTGSSSGSGDTLFAELPAFFDSVTRAPSTILKILRGNGIVSGGTVTVDSCRKLNIVPTIISLNYLQYSSAADTLTVPPSDGTFPRTDEVVDSLGYIVLKVGVPSATPVGQPINAATEVLLASYTIAAGASCLSITQIIVWDQNLGTPTEWGLTTAGTIAANGNNTDQPFHLTKAIFVSTYTSGSSLIFTYSSPLTAQATELLKFWVYLNGAFGVNQFQIQFFNGSALVGNPIAFNAGYGFNPNDSNFYQQVVAPFSAFGITTEQFDKMVITFYGNDLSGAKGLYLDYIQLQQGNSTPSTQLILTTIGSSGPSTYNSVTNVLNIPEYAGGSNPFDWSVYDSLSTPALAPFDGATYLVGTSPTGVFVGHANQIATFDSTAAIYTFQNAQVGDLLYNAGLYVVDRWNGTNWIRVPGPTNLNWWSAIDYLGNPGQFVKIGNLPSFGSLSNGSSSWGFQTFTWVPTGGENNTAVGTGSQYYNTGNGNTSIGTYSMWYGDLGSYNTAVGYRAGETNLIASDFGIALGSFSLMKANTLYVTDSVNHMHLPLDSATGTAPNVVAVDGNGNWHKYVAPIGGGGSETWQQTLINGSDLTQNNTVGLGGFPFVMNDPVGGDLLSINPVTFLSKMEANDGTASTQFRLQADLAGGNVNFNIETDNGTNQVSILGDAGDQTIEITAANGIIYNTPPSGAPTDSVLTWSDADETVKKRDAASFFSSLQQSTDKSLSLADAPLINVHGNDFTMDSSYNFLVNSLHGTYLGAQNDSVLVAIGNSAETQSVDFTASYTSFDANNYVNTVSIDPLTNTFTNSHPSTNIVRSIFNINRAVSGGNGANGIGAAIDFSLATTTQQNFSNGIITKWIDATNASRLSQLSFTGVNNGVTQTQLTLEGNGEVVINSGALRLKGYTVATLPAANQGDIAYVTDALLPTFLATVTGGGAVVTVVFYNGTNWVAQ